MVKAYTESESSSVFFQSIRSSLNLLHGLFKSAIVMNIYQAWIPTDLLEANIEAKLFRGKPWIALDNNWRHRRVVFIVWSEIEIQSSFLGTGIGWR